MPGCNCLGRKINNLYTHILFIKREARVGGGGVPEQRVAVRQEAEGGC